MKQRGLQDSRGFWFAEELGGSQRFQAFLAPFSLSHLHERPSVAFVTFVVSSCFHSFPLLRGEASGYASRAAAFYRRRLDAECRGQVFSEPPPSKEEAIRRKLHDSYGSMLRALAVLTCFRVVSRGVGSLTPRLSQWKSLKVQPMVKQVSCERIFTRLESQVAARKRGCFKTH